MAIYTPIIGHNTLYEYSSSPLNLDKNHLIIKKTNVMTTKEVADKLISLCREGKWQQAHEDLYAENAVSIEPEGTPWPKAEGMDAIRKKGEQWQNMVEEFHGNEVSEPVISKDYFAVRMMSDTTMKGMGRMQLDEISIYQVKDGKIVKEQFIYTPPPQP